MRRVLVAGVSGSGKTTFAKRLAEGLDLPYHEMDAFFHGPHWQPIPTFEADVQKVVEQDAWVFDSHGYSQVRDLMWDRADTVVWLDFSRPVALSRVLRRSASRAWSGDPMFNGNVENFNAWFDPEHPVQWSMRNYNERRDDMETRFADPRYAHIHKVRLRRPKAAEWWLSHVLT